MSLFYNPQKSGRGVSKEEASRTDKPPLQKFWEIFGRKFWQIAQLNFIYVVTCLPIITIGPATAALTHVMRKFILEQPIFVFSEYFTAFKKHFLRTVIIGIFSAMFIVAFFFNLLIFISTSVLAETPSEYGTLTLALNMVATIVFFTLNTYIYPQIICLDLSMRAILKNSFILSMAGFKRNVVTLLVFAAIVVVMVVTFPFSMIALPLAPFAQLAFLCVFNAYPAIQKYIINPHYESTGEQNPETPDFDAKSKKADKNTASVEKPNIFTDLGGQERPINKKSVKTSGKIIK